MKQEKITGFFGGSFDPVHLGHINLALAILEKYNLDEILFCPAFVAPHKKQTPPEASGEDRLSMISLVIADIPRFSVTDLEIQRKGVSFTIDTIKTLRGKKENLRLIIAQDSIKDFTKWKEYERLAVLAPPIVGIRDGFTEDVPEILKNYLIDTPRMDIDATQIRLRLKKGLYCGHLLNAKVLDYIHKHKLYSSITN